MAKKTDALSEQWAKEDAMDRAFRGIYSRPARRRFAESAMRRASSVARNEYTRDDRVRRDP